MLCGAMGRYEVISQYSYTHALRDKVVRSMVHSVCRFQSLPLRTKFEIDEPAENLDTANKMLRHVSALLSSKHIMTSCLHLSAEAYGPSYAGMALPDTEHAVICDLALQGSDGRVPEQVLAFMRTRQSPPVVCAAVRWALDNSGRSELKIALDTELRPNEMVFKLEYDVNNEVHRKLLIGDESQIAIRLRDLIVRRIVKCFIKKLIEKREKHGFVQAIICGPMKGQVGEAEQGNCDALSRLCTLCQEMIQELFDEGHRDHRRIRQDGLLRVKFAHSREEQQSKIALKEYIDGDIDIIVAYAPLTWANLG